MILVHPSRKARARAHGLQDDGDVGPDARSVRALARALLQGDAMPRAGVRVSELMTRSVLTLNPTQSVPLAEALMALHRIRHIPVVDDSGALVGLVTHRDLLRAQIHALAAPVGRIMQTNVWTIGSSCLALSALRIMRDHRIGCLPVIDEGRLVGILTEADLLVLVDSMLSGPPERARWTVERVMTPAPVTLGPEATVAEARAKMTKYGVRHLPIAAGGHALSMISDRDLRVAEIVFDKIENAVAVRAARLVAVDPVRRVQRDAALDVVLLEMFAERLDAVLVVDGDRLVGILAASDACRILGEGLRAPDAGQPI